MEIANVSKLLQRLRELHVNSYELNLRLRAELIKMKNEDRVDFAYGMQELCKLCEDIRKECKATQDTLDRAVCAVWINDNLNENTNLPVRGKFAIGTPNIKHAVKIPHPERDREKYKALAKRLGIFGAAFSHNLVRIHWPAMSTYITKLMKEGKPLPPGIDPDEVYSQYSVRLRKTQNLLEETTHGG